MRNFNRDNRSGRRRDSNRQGFGARDNSRPMYQATCAECGNECEVPFRPSGDKPVFCSSCFESKRGGNENSRRSSFEEKRMFAATCDECGKACEVPFRPTEGKPIYCHDCFGKKGGRKNKDGGNEQFNILNSKLDQILKVLVPSTTSKKPAHEKNEVKAVKKAEKSSQGKSALNGKTVKKAVAKKTAAKKAIK